MIAIAEAHDRVSASVGLHPNEQGGHDPSIDELVTLAAHPEVVAIGETGLDYFRSKGELDWQRERFWSHFAPDGDADLGAVDTDELTSLIDEHLGVAVGA